MLAGNPLTPGCLDAAVNAMDFVRMVTAATNMKMKYNRNVVS
jgi:hypothetical protein